MNSDARLIAMKTPRQRHVAITETSLGGVDLASAGPRDFTQVLVHGAMPLSRSPPCLRAAAIDLASIASS